MIAFTQTEKLSDAIWNNKTIMTQLSRDDSTQSVIRMRMQNMAVVKFRDVR